MHSSYATQTLAQRSHDTINSGKISETQVFVQYIVLQLEHRIISQAAFAQYSSAGKTTRRAREANTLCV